MKEKLDQFFNDTLSEEERNEVLDWINSSDTNKREFIQIKNIRALSYINMKGKANDAGFAELSKKLKVRSAKPQRIVMTQVLRYAAALIAGVIISSAIFFASRKNSGSKEQNFEIYCPPGQISQLTLGDGTQIWLNSDSRIKYASNFNSDSREVYLEGEAYFDVAKNKQLPFFVNTHFLNIKVTGTSFNVEADPAETSFSTVLVEGAISIFNGKDKKLAQLHPGEKAEYSEESGSLNLSQINNSSDYTSWREGKLCFVNERLEDIAYRLEKWYNVRFIFVDEVVKDVTFSGTILKYKPLNQILEIIQLTSPIEYSVKINNETQNEIKLYKKSRNM